MSIHPKIKIHMSIIVSFQYLVKGNTVSHYCLYCIRISKRLEMYPQMKLFEWTYTSHIRSSTGRTFPHAFLTYL